MPRYNPPINRTAPNIQPDAKIERVNQNDPSGEFKRISDDLSTITSLLNTPGQIKEQRDKAADTFTRIACYRMGDEGLDETYQLIVNRLIAQPEGAGLTILRRAEERLPVRNPARRADVVNNLKNAGIFGDDDKILHARYNEISEQLSETVESCNKVARHYYQSNIGTVTDKTVQALQASILSDNNVTGTKRMSIKDSRKQVTDWLNGLHV